MKNSLTCLLFIVVASTLHSQTSPAVPLLVKYPIGESGCQIYLPATPVFELSYSEDSSEVWTTEVQSENFNYGVICVRFRDSMEGYGETDLNELIISYLDFLQAQFSVTLRAGYTEGYYLTEYPEIHGVLDFWQDADELQYAVMGWINTKYLIVLMIYGKEKPDNTIYNPFFQSLHYPE